jgi:SsrA-binding protein
MSVKVFAENRKAYFDYQILEKFEAGIELKGFEVKAIKTGRINISGSYAVVKNNQLWLLNADIPSYQPKNMPKNYDSKRSRRLLLHAKEIKYLIGKIHEKLTLVPLRVYTKGRRIKIEIGLARGKKKADKREAIRKRESRREIEKTLKSE